METAEKYLAMRSLIQKTEDRALVYGVTISEYLTLKEIQIAGTEGISRSELAANLGKSVLDLTKALMPLEKLCFVETLAATDNPRDRKVAMTQGGRGIYGDIEHEFLRRMNLMTFELTKFLRDLTN
jgi:DNA-binding MarR family transcriptional regulator